MILIFLFFFQISYAFEINDFEPKSLIAGFEKKPTVSQIEQFIKHPQTNKHTLLLTSYLPTKSKLKIIGNAGKDETGTKITFWPDEQIFSTLEFDYKFLENRFREVAFLKLYLIG